MAPPASSSMDAPINVDHDSDATLSSDSDVDMDRPNRAVAEPPQETDRLSRPTATFSESMAAARDNLVRSAAAVMGSASAAPRALSTANGKKRRLSSPPPALEHDRQKQQGIPKRRASLDFCLALASKRHDRSMQLIEEDEVVEDEEAKANPGEKQNGGASEWSNGHRRPPSAVGAMSRVESVRTWVCGRWFGKCTLEFHAVYVSISLYSLPSSEGTIVCEFRGSIQNRQLERFSLSRGPAPYFAILEFSRRTDFEPAFAQFYDGIFARVTEQEGPSVEPDIYGVLLFFDDDLELARCQSLCDVSTTLQSLLERTIPVDEATQVRMLKFEPQSSASAQRSSTSILSMITGSVKGTIDTISNLFSDRSPLKLRQSKIHIDATKANDNDSSAMSTRFRTSSRRKSLLQQAARDAEVVVQLSGDTDTEHKTSGAADIENDRRSTRGVMKLLQEHHRSETQRLAAERKAKLLLSYPFDEHSRTGQISITYGDIDRLKPGEFLNDSIIDFYLRYLWRHVEPWQQQLVYFFSSHFFTQLCGGKLSGGVSLTEDRLRRVARWTQKENLFEKRFIFVPINDSFHWSVAVLCNPGSAIVHKRRRPQSRNARSGLNNNVILIDSNEETVVVDTTEDASDSEEEELVQKERMENPPCLLFLDSLRCHQKKKICTLLKSYIEYEFRTRFGVQQDSTSAESETVTTFDLDAITMIEPEIPLQSNSSDCGVFLLMYTAQILQRFPSGVCQLDVTSKLSSSMSKQMFDDGHVQEFRDYLHQLIFMLQKIERRGGNEMAIKTEGLEFFAVEH